MRVDEFDFDLPSENIALRPVMPRDAARMLVVQPDTQEPIINRNVLDLPSLLREGDAMVFNDTKVIPAELRGQRVRNGNVTPISLTLHLRKQPDLWIAFARPAKRLKADDQLEFLRNDHCLRATVEQRVGAEVYVRFDRSGEALDAAIQQIGHIPLPPYIAARRGEDQQDRDDYQTVFARRDGAVAAPTAGLHFTDTLLKQLQDMNVSQHWLTLHVGAGTFLPVKSDDTNDHRMHAEWGEVSRQTADALNTVRAGGGRIIAVGTTSLRLLESAADTSGHLHPFCGETDIFITPGYQFRATDLLMTNFHLPRSTLFMLVSAFSGLSTMQAAYRHAIEDGYRFYSYGDSSLLFPKKKP
ncbi:MAG: tRNA preQ1(34) S-adenosylmethionine ribosyltransferase-isomerase QueA [Stappiaceae bacterium]